jgi:N-acetyl-1-D-myo-inositol-2-amino-2-deoxy-alpha-D-glucopyranoside deacetylase
MTILAVYAHPDDEVPFFWWYARYAEGHQVYLLWATRGEAGGVVHPESGFGTSVQYHNPRALVHQDIFQLEQELLELMKGLGPDILLTFDPHGGYRHLDHIVMHRVATAAFWSSGGYLVRPLVRLFYMTRSLGEARRSNALEPQRYSLSQDSFAARVAIRAYVHLKREAF